MQHNRRLGALRLICDQDECPNLTAFLQRGASLAFAPQSLRELGAAIASQPRYFQPPTATPSVKPHLTRILASFIAPAVRREAEDDWER